MTSDRPTFVVVGGGIVGLLSALAASENGAVTVFDPAPARGATYAAAGMLSPGAELLAGEVHALPDAIDSHTKWPDFAQMVGLTTDEYQTGAGSVLTGLTYGDLAEVSRLTSAAVGGGLTLREILRQDDPATISDLSPRFTKAVHFPADSFVDVDALTNRLVGLLKQRGVSFDDREVASVDFNDGALSTSEGSRFSFAQGMICTGASMDLVRHQANQKVRSVRGVTVRLQRRGHFEPRMVRALIDGRMIYVVERANGTVVIGASSDESAERYVDALAVADLLRLAIQLIPSLDEA